MFVKKTSRRGSYLLYWHYVYNNEWIPCKIAIIKEIVGFVSQTNFPRKLWHCTQSLSIPKYVAQISIWIILRRSTFNNRKCLEAVSGTGILLPKLFWPTVRKNCSKGQLISKGLFGVIVWTKNPKNFVKDFCPSL